MKSFTNIAISFAVLAPAGAQTYLSPCDIDQSPDKKTIYITAHTGKQLLCFDIAGQKMAKSIDLPAEPTDTVHSLDGKTLFVAGGGPDGRIWKLQNGTITDEFITGHTPMSPVPKRVPVKRFRQQEGRNKTEYLNLFF